MAGTEFAGPAPIPYRFLARRESMFSSPTLALTDDRWKFLTNLGEDGAEDLLFDVVADRGETADVLAEHRERGTAMKEHLRAFIASCRRSHHGADYPEPEPPADPFQEPGGWA